MKSAGKRNVARWAEQAFPLSERRACRLVSIDRSTRRYPSRSLRLNASTSAGQGISSPTGWSTVDAFALGRWSICGPANAWRCIPSARSPDNRSPPNSLPSLFAAGRPKRSPSTTDRSSVHERWRRGAKLRASSWRSSHRAGQWRTPSSQASTDDCVTSFSTSRSFSTCRTWRTNSNTGAATTIAVARLALSPIRRRKSSRDGKLAPLKDPLAAAPAGPSLSHRELAVEGLIQAPRLFPLQPFSRRAIRSQVRPTEAAIFPAENRFDPTILTLVMALFSRAGQTRRTSNPT